MTATAETNPAGRVVLITGGSRGIGQACARWFLDHGDRVAVTSRSGAVAAEPADHFLSLACDVTDPEQVEAAFTAVEALLTSVSAAAAVSVSIAAVTPAVRSCASSASRTEVGRNSCSADAGSDNSCQYWPKSFS